MAPCHLARFLIAMPGLVKTPPSAQLGKKMQTYYRGASVPKPAQIHFIKTKQSKHPVECYL